MMDNLWAGLKVTHELDVGWYVGSTWLSVRKKKQKEPPELLQPWFSPPDHLALILLLMKEVKLRGGVHIEVGGGKKKGLTSEEHDDFRGKT